MVANIAVVGAGWWGQGWHIPCLHRNPHAHLLAVVDQNSHPQSDMNRDFDNSSNNLVSLVEIQQRFSTRIFHSVQELLQHVGPDLDGVIISTTHSSHFKIALEIHEYNLKHRNSKNKNKNNNSISLEASVGAVSLDHRQHPIHILMEKPMATDMDDARALYEMVQSAASSSSSFGFWINHSANFRQQAQLAREAVQRIGSIRHVTCSMASPLMWLFSNPENLTWTQPSGTMLGNGFAWGQSCHLLGWVYFVCGGDGGDENGGGLKPSQVFCAMNHEPITGADMSHSATILCENDIVLNVSGTAWLPGSQYSQSKQVGKQIRIQIYGTQGAILYEGDDALPSSGHLEWRKEDGSCEILADHFLFENSSPLGYGAESVTDFVEMCSWSATAEAVNNKNLGTNEDRSSPPPMNCATVLIGLRTVQTMEAMYRSHASKTIVNVL
ncbi:hypothetical protein ACA910_005217 [Epithemia clementina (nom. ined.)]